MFMPLKISANRNCLTFLFCPSLSLVRLVDLQNLLKMLAFATLFAFVACYMHASVQGACDIQELCNKVDESLRKVDALNEKLDRVLLPVRLEATLENVDTSNFDVSDVYEDRIYLCSKSQAVFSIAASNNVCKAQGGYLVELDDNNEKNFLIAFLRDLSTTGPYYTGGNDIYQEGRWVYFNSGKPVPSGLTWRRGEPNNSGGNEDCMNLQTGNSGINDIPCSRNGRYVCEVPLQ